MSARWQRRLSRPEPPAEFDPFEGLGPGDPGYRLRGGRTGLDPFESTLEQSRFAGMALKWMLGNRIMRAVVVVIGAALLTTLVQTHAYGTLALLATIAVGVGIIAAIARQDLDDIRRRRR